MKNPWSVVAAGALLAFHATTTQAQLTITPLVGAYIPRSSLKDVQSGASNVTVRRDGTLALGLNIETGMLRLGAAYASGTTIKDANKAELAKGTVLAAGADIVVRPLPRIIAQPYVLGGVGVKNLSYDQGSGIVGAFPRDTRELAIHAGLGADAMFGPVGIVAELTDFVSRDANDKWKIHDAFLMAGIKIRM